ncbi:MAG: adenylate/guanylate cyclase domain-containing protein [Verrucomicrobiota bacterium]
MRGTLRNIETGEQFELTGVTMLGRSEECAVRIGDPRVSRRHAMIRVQERGFYIFDLGSFNGSYLNGSRITAARRLKSGDVLQFADHEFHFEQVGESNAMDGDTLGGSTMALIRSRPVVILVSDIRGFTKLSEVLDPDDLAQIIGSWYAECERIVANGGGTVDKFIGDCVLAYWTEVNPETLNNALNTAAGIKQACAAINKARADLLGDSNSFSAGFALHTGKVAYGGMSQREFTLVGDPVNLAFRLETLTRELNEDVLVSGDFVRALPQSRSLFRNLGVHKVKGRAQGVEVHALIE